MKMLKNSCKTKQKLKKRSPNDVSQLQKVVKNHYKINENCIFDTFLKTHNIRFCLLL